MSEKYIKINFQLSDAFSSYVLKHPEVMRGIPNKVCIVMTSKEHLGLTRKNLKIAREVIRKERKKCYRAIKDNRKWRLEPITAINR